MRFSLYRWCRAAPSSTRIVMKVNLPSYVAAVLLAGGFCASSAPAEAHGGPELMPGHYDFNAVVASDGSDANCPFQTLETLQFHFVFSPSGKSVIRFTPVGTHAPDGATSGVVILTLAGNPAKG